MVGGQKSPLNDVHQRVLSSKAEESASKTSSLNISEHLLRCLAESRPSGRNGRERERENVKVHTHTGKTAWGVGWLLSARVELR